MSKENTISIESIMESIRAEVKKEAAQLKPGFDAFKPPISALNMPQTGSVMYCEELAYLNKHWNDFLDNAEISSHRKIIGRIIVKIKQGIRGFIINSLLRNYFEQERYFQMQLVKFLNALTRYVDSRDADLFWESNKKADNDLQAMILRNDSLFEQLASTLENETLNREKSFECLRYEISELKNNLANLESKRE